MAPASAEADLVVTGRVSPSHGAPFDSAAVRACPGEAPADPAAYFACPGGMTASVSVFNGHWSLSLPAGTWTARAAGLYCGQPHLSPGPQPVTGGSLDFVIDTSAVPVPEERDFAPPFADGYHVAGEVDASDGDLHLALRDASRRILVRGLGGSCVDLHVPYRPLPVLVLKPEGDGPFPLVVLSHGGGEVMPNPGKVAAAQEYVGKGYVAAVPTYPLTARSIGRTDGGVPWPGGYLRDIDDQGIDLALALDALVALPFVDGDRIGLTGVSAGGYTSLQTAFHSSGYPDGIRAVATEIARPLAAPSELDLPLATPDIPLLMANNVDDTVTTFGPADDLWWAATGPKHRWLEDTPEVNPVADHGFSTFDSQALQHLFLDAYVLGDPDARAWLDAYPSISSELRYESVPAEEGYEGPLARHLSVKRGRTVPITVQLHAKVGPAVVTDVVDGSGTVLQLPLTFDRLAGTYEALLRTKDLAPGSYSVRTATPFGTFVQALTITR